MAGPPDAVRLVRPVKRRCEAAARNKKALSKMNKTRRKKNHDRVCKIFPGC